MFINYITKLNKFNEIKASKYIKTIINAIGYCHSKNIIHCDLKPQNIMFDKPHLDTIAAIPDIKENEPIKDIDYKENINIDNEPKLMLIDFGLAIELPETEEIDYSAGTVSYMAPENFAYIKRTGKIMRASDMWSIGIIAYLLVCGEKPFKGGNEFKLMQSILLDGVKWPINNNLSNNCKKFILGLLNKDAVKRFTAEQALGDIWLKEPSNNIIENDNFDDKFEYILINAPLINLKETEKKLIDFGLHKLTNNNITQNAIYDYLVKRGVKENIALQRTEQLLKMLFIHNCDTDSLQSINISEMMSSIITTQLQPIPKPNVNQKNKKRDNHCCVM